MSEIYREKPVLVPHCPPKISRVLAWDRTQSFVEIPPDINAYLSTMNGITIQHRPMFAGTGRWGDTDMEGRPSRPDGSTGQNALAPHFASVLKPQSREADPFPAK